MAVDPNAPQGLPPGVPPDPAAAGAAPPGAPGAPGAPAAPNPTTDPNALAAVLNAILEQGREQFVQQQQAALGTAVTALLQQQPNAAGEAASTLPGGPTPPPMPNDGSVDPTMQGAAGGYGP